MSLPNQKLFSGNHKILTLTIDHFHKKTVYLLLAVVFCVDDQLFLQKIPIKRVLVMQTITLNLTSWILFIEKIVLFVLCGKIRK